MESRETARSRPWRVVEQEISDLLSRVETQAFERLLQAFGVKGRRWFFSGQGRSGLVAQMAAMRFMHAGYDVHVLGEVTAPSVRRGDGLVLVCGSGQTPISVGLAGVAKSEGAKLVVLTHKPHSKLAGMADVLLSIPMETTVQFGGSLFEHAVSFCSTALCFSLPSTSMTPILPCGIGIPTCNELTSAASWP
jgi:6-phospho-3-hexuloisomerase